MFRDLLSRVMCTAASGSLVQLKACSQSLQQQCPSLQIIVLPFMYSLLFEIFNIQR
jgi:hypothetical protein